MWARPWLPSKPSSAPRRQAACPGASQSGMVSSPLLPGARSLAAALRASSRRAVPAVGSPPPGPSSSVRYQLTVPDWLAPGQAAWRRGALLGFDGSQGRAHIYRSILEGIALTMANNTAAMEHALGRRLSPVLVSGGGSRSDLMMQIVADVYGRPARRTTVNDSAGLGAAICAAVGHGIYPGWDQATAAMVSPGRQFTPDPGAVRAYQQINQVYATLTSHTDPLFRSMADGLAGLDRT